MKRLLPALTVVPVLPVLLAVFLLPLALTGQSREIIQLQADIVSLDQRVAEIQRSLDERNSTVQDLVEQLFDRVVGLGSSVERIVTAMDQVQTGNDRISGELRVMIDSLSNDFDVMDRTLGDIRADVSSLSQQMTSLSATTQDLGSPDNLLREASVDMLTGNYELARLGYQDFLHAFPDSPLADDAQLGLGDSYYSEGLWEQTILEYDLLLQRYPDSDRLEDALLKKGLALAEFGQDELAIEIFGEIVTSYPETSHAIRAQEEIDLRN
jgi:tol-pal system protein YbgF